MNRRVLLTLLAGAPIMTTLPAFGQAAPGHDDSADIFAWLKNFEATWAASDAEGMFRMATDDVEWVNIVGMHWRGKAEVVLAHRVYLTTMFRGVSNTLSEVESLRMLGPDVVVAVARWSVGQFSPPDGSVVPAADDRMTLVFKRTPDGLMLAHGANVQIDPRAADNDPTKSGPPAA